MFESGHAGLCTVVVKCNEIASLYVDVLDFFSDIMKFRQAVREEFSDCTCLTGKSYNFGGDSYRRSSSNLLSYYFSSYSYLLTGHTESLRCMSFQVRFTKNL